MWYGCCCKDYEGYISSSFPWSHFLLGWWKVCIFVPYWKVFELNAKKKIIDWFILYIFNGFKDLYDWQHFIETLKEGVHIVVFVYVEFCWMDFCFNQCDKDRKLWIFVSINSDVCICWILFTVVFFFNRFPVCIYIWIDFCFNQCDRDRDRKLCWILFGLI